jgi:hypothetical protein
VRRFSSSLVERIERKERNWKAAYVRDLIFVGVLEENVVLHELTSLSSTTDRKANDVLLDIPEATNIPKGQLNDGCYVIV